MNSKRSVASFTLVEMLVGIAVFSLLMLLLLTIMGSSMKLWRQQSSKEESFREARAALNVLARDMSAAVISTNAYWFYSNGTNQLAFLTTLPYTGQGSAESPNYALGDICAVGYSLEYSTNDTSESQYNMSLYRYISFSNPTYTNFLSGANPVENIFTSVDGTNTVRQLIARDIPQVSFVVYTNDSTGTPWVVPTSQLSDLGLPSNMTINVGLTALNDRTAVLLTTQAQWQATNALLLQNEELFALRVRPQVP